jgi:hypothetical protein
MATVNPKRSEAVHKFLYHVGRINDHLCRVYRDSDTGSDLRQEEEYATDWANKLIKLLPDNNLENYEAYEDSVLKFQAARSCSDRLDDKKVPQGAEVLTRVFESGKLADFTGLNRSTIYRRQRSFGGYSGKPNQACRNN